MRQQSARARFSNRNRFLTLCKQLHQHFLESFIIGGKDRQSELVPNNRVGARYSIGLAHDPDVDLPGPRAVTKLNSLNGENFFADCFFDNRLAQARDSVNSPIQRLGVFYDSLQDRHNRFPKHRLKFARRAWQQEKMRRTGLRIDVRLQI